MGQVRICIICNGTLNGVDFNRNTLADADTVICADGGANHAFSLGVVPDYVIGDMDSVGAEVLHKLENNKGTRVIVDKDQDRTDTELAIELALTLDPQEILLLCAIGARIDHTIANIICLNMIREIPARILDKDNEIYLMQGNDLKNNLELSGRKDDIVSVIPLNELKGLEYDGLKWDVPDKVKNFGWLGICNRMSDDQAKISFESGDVIVIKIKR